MRTILPPLAVAGLFLVGLAALPGQGNPDHGGAALRGDTLVVSLRTEAAALRLLFRSRLVRNFLDGTVHLRPVQPRTVLHDSSRTRYWTEKEAAALPDSARARLVSSTFDEHFYYYTRYGSPLAYARPLEIVAESGLENLAGRRLADFGYGSIGHLRLLAGMGADVHGIEVDPLLRALYAEHTSLAGELGGRAGTLSLHHGRWPADSALVTEVGTGYELFLSKNTLKNGYIHPAEKVNPRMLVHLGVNDTAFVQALARAVKPGGLVMIYNLCPAPAPPGKPYIPWADGRCPFPRALWASAGFEVLAFDADDSRKARAMGHALGWDQGEPPMNLEHDLYAIYSLFRRR